MGWGRNSDKRGSTSGGSSTGRSGQKRGGRDATPDPNDVADRGMLTCPKCSGAGRLGVPRYETITHVDDDGNVEEVEHYAGEDYKQCKKCAGTGKVKA
jgi:hypothetical protein